MLVIHHVRVGQSVDRSWCGKYIGWHAALPSMSEDDFREKREKNLTVNVCRNCRKGIEAHERKLAEQERRTRILRYVRRYPGRTAAEIAAALNTSARSVANYLCWMRGSGLVHDGSQADPTFNTAGELLGIAHTPAPSPIRWTATHR